jgi:hypothetical protein
MKEVLRSIRPQQPVWLVFMLVSVVFTGFPTVFPGRILKLP